MGHIALLLSVFTAPAYAQYQASLQGVVVDVQAAGIPAASIALKSRETGIARTTTTNETGGYAIPGLAPGTYSLTAERAGFSRKVFETIVIRAEQTHSLNIELAVGQTSDSITVSETAAPLLNTQNAVIAGTITTREIENLPSFARDPFQLARLAPGVFGNGAIAAGGGTTSMPGVNRPSAGTANSIFFIENGPQVIANGTRQNANNIQVDGVGVNSVTWGGSAVVTPNEESIQEVKITANNYTAEDGRNSGAQIQVISRSGTNTVHGSGFFKWHRPGLNAFQRWNGPGNPSPVRRDLNRFNQFGGSLGGPVVKDKLFAFFSYEGLRSGSKNSSPVWFETPQFLANAGPANSLARRITAFPGQTPLIAEASPLTCAQVGLAASQCRDAAGGLDLGSPLRTPLGTPDTSWGQPATPFGIGNGFDGIPDVMRALTLTPSSNINAQYNGRMDFRPTSLDLIAVSVYWVPTLTNSINGPARGLNQWTSDRLSRSWTGLWNRTLSPTVLNEARFGLSGWKFDETQSNPDQPWGFPQTISDAFGSVAVQRFGASGPGVFDQGTWNVRDTLSTTKGRHFLKLGGDLSRMRILDRSAGSARPTFRFRNLWSFANDAPYQETGTFNPVTGEPSDNTKHLRLSILALFIQDDWKLKPNFTLNLGLRYEYYSPLKATENVISNPILGPGAEALTAMRLQIGNSLSTTSKTNFGPQAGFAWSPGALRKKLVLRGGFGVGFNVQQAATLANGRNNPPWITSLTLLNADILYAFPSDPKQFSGWPANPAARQRFDDASGLPLSGAAVTLNGFPQQQNTPYTLRYSLDAQYELGRGWAATLGYQGSQSRNLSRQRNLNLNFFPALNPRVNRMFWFSNDASAGFNALLAQLQRRFSSQFTFDFQYRLSRNIDQGSQDYYTDQYPFDISYSKGPADYDVTHDFKAWGVYTPTLFRGRRNWLEKVAGGWTFSGILNAHSGFPWTPTYSNTGGNIIYPNSGYGTLRPGSYAGGAETDFSNSSFIRPRGNFPQGALTYFTVPVWSSNGVPPPPGVGRNTFRGPRYWNLDATFAKSFGLPNTGFLGERARLNLQANANNLLNRLNPTGINTIISTDGRTSNPLFGQAQSAFSGRIVELQARFSF